MRTPIAVFALALLPSTLAAQGWIEPPDRRPHAPAVVKERTAVRVRIAGRIAHVEVEEWFRNTGGGLAGGDYLYPLPGEEPVIFGRYAAADDRTGEVALTGQRGERANDFIPRLRASRKVGAPMRQLRLQGPNPELEEEIRQTALRYGILSEFTAYLVEEPVAAAAPRAGRLPDAAGGRDRTTGAAIPRTLSA